MKKTIIGILLFMVQIGLALFYNQSVDLIYVAGIAVITFGFILYSYFSGKYQNSNNAAA